MTQDTKTAPPPLTLDAVEERLKRDLPHWQVRDGWIIRDYRTSGWKSSLILVNTIGHLAEAAWHHPDISLTYARVRVKLMTHSEKGITEKDLALALKIESVVQWKPQDEFPEILEGTPQDPRFKFLHYD